MDRWERCLCDFEGALPARLQLRIKQPVSADWHNEAKKINLFKGGRQELARRVAEAEIDLRRIRYARHRLLSAALSGRKIAIQAFDATRMLLCLQERNKQP
jgi:hypothetical protein